MNSICDYCLNYEPKKKKDVSNKSKETCNQASFIVDENKDEMVCKNFAFVLALDISSDVVERFLRKDINFYDNLCDLSIMILEMFSYRTIFKVRFDIEHGKVELIDMTNSGTTYGDFDISSIELNKGYVIFESTDEFRQLVLGVIEPESLIFVEFKDFEYNHPIKGVFAKPNYLYNKNKLTLWMKSFNDKEVW